MEPLWTEYLRLIAACNTQKSGLDWSALAAVGSFITAIAAAYIAWKQWHTSKGQLRAELFEKRLLVYRAARGVAVKGYSRQLTVEDESIYLAGIADCRWVLGPELTEYLEKTLWMQVYRQANIVRMGDSTATSEEHQKAHADRAASFRWFESARANIDEMFDPFLNLSDLDLHPFFPLRLR